MNQNDEQKNQPNIDEPTIDAQQHQSSNDGLVDPQSEIDKDEFEQHSSEQTSQSEQQIDQQSELAEQGDESLPDAEQTVKPVAEFVLPEVQPQAQEEMHFAMVDGEPISEVPKDLFIPPDALEVFLEAFEGPLDLLLYLIKRQNLDILSIPIAHITEQYMEYVELMKSINLELAAEYLVMAAMLAEIKSRVLLPRPKLDEDEDDPRADLIRRLQEYERFKKAAMDVDELPRMGRDTFQAEAQTPELHINKALPDVDMRDILMALKDVLVRAEMFTSHQIQREALSTREKMAHVLAILSADNFTDFISLFKVEEGRAGVVVTFLAIMELTKESLVELVQGDPFSPIHVRAKIS
jgi:segregation and condensation protein A